MDDLAALKAAVSGIAPSSSSSPESPAASSVVEPRSNPRIDLDLDDEFDELLADDDDAEGDSDFLAALLSGGSSGEPSVLGGSSGSSSTSSFTSVLASAGDNEWSTFLSSMQLPVEQPPLQTQDASPYYTALHMVPTPVGTQPPMQVQPLPQVVYVQSVPATTPSIPMQPSHVPVAAPSSITPSSAYNTQNQLMHLEAQIQQLQLRIQQKQQQQHQQQQQYQQQEVAAVPVPAAPVVAIPAAMPTTPIAPVTVPAIPATAAVATAVAYAPPPPVPSRASKPSLLRDSQTQVAVPVSQPTTLVQQQAPIQVQAPAAPVPTPVAPAPAPAPLTLLHPSEIPAMEKRATHMIGLAKEAESKGYLKRALEFYQDALGKIHICYMSEPNEARKYYLRQQLQYHLTRAEEVKAWLEPKKIANANYNAGDNLVRQGRELEDSSLIDQAIAKYKSALGSFQKAFNEELTPDKKRVVAQRILLCEKRLEQLLEVRKYVRIFLPFPFRVGYDLIETTVKVTGVGEMAQNKIHNELEKMARR